MFVFILTGAGDGGSPPGPEPDEEEKLRFGDDAPMAARTRQNLREALALGMSAAGLRYAWAYQSKGVASPEGVPPDELASLNGSKRLRLLRECFVRTAELASQDADLGRRFEKEVSIFCYALDKELKACDATPRVTDKSDG
jgi:hypothetical protein